MKTILKLNLSLPICSAESPSLLGTPKRRRLETTSKVGRNASRSRFLHALGLAITLGMVFVPSPLRAGCNQPPIPAPGQTVTWTAANSPFQICVDLTIPKGGKVIVQPGVQLQFQGHMLTVSGSLNVQGPIGQPLFRLSLMTSSLRRSTVDGGNLVMSFTDVGGQIRPGPGKITISDSTFSGRTDLIFTLDILLPISAAGHQADRAAPSPVRKCKLPIPIWCSRIHLHEHSQRRYCAVTFACWAPIRLTGNLSRSSRDLSSHPTAARGWHPCFECDDSGRNQPDRRKFSSRLKNVLQGNLYPVDVEGGLLPSSVVPLTGNTINMIWAHDGGSQGVMRWANLGLPYLVTNLINGGGPLTIDPGVTVKFDPTVTGFAGLSIVSTRRLIANGLPDKPITFDALNPGRPGAGCCSTPITRKAHIWTTSS